MNTFKTLSFLIIYLLSACSQNTSGKEPLEVTQGQTSKAQIATPITSQDHQKSIPEFLTSSEKFLSFVNDTNLDYEQKSVLIDEFFAQRELYTESQVLDVFITIGAKTQWDVDLISQFQYRMEEVISTQPDMLCKIADRLSNKEMSKFIDFYLGGVIWVDKFPNEFYTLQTCHTSKFDIVAESFYRRYLEMSTRQMTQRYVVSDPDGNTNLRAKPSSHSSQIVGVIDNGKHVIPLWQESDWLFVKADNQMGYVYNRNFSEIKEDVSANTASVASRQSFPQKANGRQMAVKIYFDVDNEHMQPYVIRQVSALFPLKQALETYLKGVTREESTQGYRSNTLGIEHVEAAVKNHVANIHFYTKAPQIESPTQVINFTYNVTRIADQFTGINSVQIYINGMSNYQIAFFANEPLVYCKF